MDKAPCEALGVTEESKTNEVPVLLLTCLLTTLHTYLLKCLWLLSQSYNPKCPSGSTGGGFSNTRSRMMESTAILFL